MAEPGAGEGASIARFSVRQPVLVNLIALAMVVTGGYLLSRMTREVYPSVPVGGASILTIVPGASAEEVEQLVTAPLEDELSDIEDVDVISSTSSDGLSFIWVEMDASVEDTGRKVLEITNEVNRVTNLPAGAQAPVVREAAVRIPTIAVTVGGDAPEAVLRSVAREMEERLGRIDGVGQVTTTGIRDRELHVDVDPDRLEAYGVPLAAVAGALTGRGSNVPAGHMDSGRHSRMVRGMAQTVTAADVERVVVRPSAQGGSLTVGDLARVEEGYERARTVARVDGEPGIVFILLKDDQADALRISEDARAVVRAMQAEAPPGVRIGVFGDTAFWVRANLDGAEVRPRARTATLPIGE